MVEADYYRTLESAMPGLGERERVAFMAGCSERVAPGFLGPPPVRPRDAATFQQVLDGLWLMAADGDPEHVAGLAERLSSFPEIEAEEEQEGRLAFAEDAVLALWYALDGDAVACAKCVSDAMGFIDQENPRPSRLYQEEVQKQLRDLKKLGALREESQQMASRVLDALRQIEFD